MSSPILIPVHAAADAEAVREFSDFLSRGSRVRVLTGDGRVEPGVPLVECVERALSADLVVVFLSPAALAVRSSGAEWEAVLGEQAIEMGVGIASILVSTCAAPAMLRRRTAFDGSTDRLAAFRACKQWVMNRLWPGEFHPPAGPPGPVGAARSDPWLDELRAEISDRPGSVFTTPAVLQSFVDAFCRDFERVIRLDCRDRYEENLLSEFAVQAGVAPTGTIEEVERRVVEALAERRLLLALDNLTSESQLPPLGSLCSLIATEPVDLPSWEPAEILARMRAWATDEKSATTLLPPAHALFDLGCRADWPVAAEMGRLAFLIAKRNGREAESLCWLERLERAALERGDRAVAFESAQEKAWILEGWNAAAPRVETASECGEQLSLF